MQTPVASVRFVAVSATIPNVHDIARWLRVPQRGLRVYGASLRTLLAAAAAQSHVDIRFHNFSLQLWPTQHSIWAASVELHGV